MSKMAVPSKTRSVNCISTISIANLLGTSKLDSVIRACASTSLCGLGAQQIGCCCGTSCAPCGPCGSFGPVQCPCQLCSPPMGTRCCVILQPKCRSTVRGCRMCCNYSGLPCQQCERPRCLKQRCCFCC